jgi:hypothetical protein
MIRGAAPFFVHIALSLFTARIIARTDVIFPDESKITKQKQSDLGDRALKKARAFSFDTKFRIHFVEC